MNRPWVNLEIGAGMEISVKNHADTMIFHTAICAAGITNSHDCRAEFEIQPAIPSTQRVCGMEINMNKAKYIYASAVGVIVIGCVILIISIATGNNNIKNKNNSDSQIKSEEAYDADMKLNAEAGKASVDDENNGNSLDADKSDKNHSDPDEGDISGRQAGDVQTEVYRLVLENDRISIYEDDAFFDYADINIYSIPADVQKKLINGIELQGEQQLYEFLQTYSS